MKTRCIAIFALALAACDDIPPEPPADDSALDCDLADGPHAIELISASPLVFAWSGDAWAAALTSPDASLGAFGRIRTGRLYWSIAASDFGGELRGPVELGVVPTEATNYTAFGGGTYADPEPGRCYELQLSDGSHRSFSRLQFRAP